LFFLLLGTWIIHFPDLVKASFKIVSVNAPKAVVARSEGKLIKLFASEGDRVEEREAIAYLESTAKHEQVLQLESQLEKAWRLVIAGQLDSLHKLDVNNYHQLGELQNSFQIFVQSYMELKNFLTDGYYLQNKKLLEGEYKDLEALDNSLAIQKTIHESDMLLAQEEYNAQKQLANDKVIAPLELKREESKNIVRKLPYQQIATALINNSLAKKAKKKEMLELDKQLTQGKDNFLQSVNTLKSELEAWKLRYIITAPLSGAVYFSSVIQENQYLSANQELLFIAPVNSEFYGELQIPQQNIGKVAIGQEVIVKFAGFPFEEYGIVKGRIHSIANISTNDSIFRAKVLLPNGLKTNYGKELSYKTGMAASAEIITLDQRIIEKLFYQLRKLMGGRG
jgi:HlyD family secretion protein